MSSKLLPYHSSGTTVLKRRCVPYEITSRAIIGTRTRGYRPLVQPKQHYERAALVQLQSVGLVIKKLLTLDSILELVMCRCDSGWNTLRLFSIEAKQSNSCGGPAWRKTC